MNNREVFEANRVEAEAALGFDAVEVIAALIDEIKELKAHIARLNAQLIERDNAVLARLMREARGVLTTPPDSV